MYFVSYTAKKNKGEFNEKKLTQAELMERQQQRLM